MDQEAAIALARAFIGLTPLAILGFLTSFLVWMGRGRHDNRFTRACEVAMAPLGILSVALVLGTLILF